MIKPILIERDSTNNPDNIHIESTGKMVLVHGSYIKKQFDIILIDTEAEIVEGDYIYYNGEIITFEGYNKIDSIWMESVNLKQKVIATTDKSLWRKKRIDSSTHQNEPLPQLSSQSIQILINYYNEHKELPEFVNVEYEKLYSYEAADEFDEVGYCGDRIKLNQQGEVDITIPEVKDIYETKEYKEACRSEWEEYDKEKLYTEEEVRRLCSQAWLVLCNNETCLEDFGKWFNSKKK